MLSELKWNNFHDLSVLLKNYASLSFQATQACRSGFALLVSSNSTSHIQQARLN
jgi:hypothetical protein